MQCVGQYSKQIVDTMPLIVACLVRRKNYRKVGPICGREKALWWAVIAIDCLESSERFAAEVAERRLPMLPKLRLRGYLQGNPKELSLGAKRLRIERIVGSVTQGEVEHPYSRMHC